MISFLRKALPAPAKHTLHGAFAWLSARSVQIFSANRWLASLYYCFFSRRFDREHLAVLKGRADYHRKVLTLERSSPLLRRNVHRLEKGLIMRPRRKVFAEAFILDTVRSYNRACDRPGYSVGELQWARDVLDEYFAVVKDTPAIVEARNEYRVCLEIREKDAHQIRAFKPYPMSECPSSPVSFEQLTRLFVRRRSVRWYQQQPVPKDLIQKAINAASQAPSACNRQPFRFIVANEQAMAAKIAECAGGTSGFAHQLSAIIVAVGDLSAYPQERDRHLIYVDTSLASMLLMLAAETLGLSTCPINWPDVDRAEEKLQRVLKLADHERVVMLIAIGYGDPNGGIPYSQKKTDSLIMQNFVKK